MGGSPEVAGAETLGRGSGVAVPGVAVAGVVEELLTRR
jgi:hypothetical protein